MIVHTLGKKGERMMPHYRICTIGKDNQIVRADELTLPADHEAFIHAIQLINDQHGAEIWEASRLVATLAHLATTRAAAETHSMR